MTVRTDGHQDQTSSTNAVASPRTPVTDGQKRPEVHGSSSTVERIRPERNRRGASFALGAPLTAAFIGGLLVIENLANAEPPDEDDIATSADEALLFEDDIGEQADLAPSSGSAAAAAAAADLSEDAGSALDPEAAPSEDGSFRSVDAGIAPGSETPAVATDASAISLADGGDAAASETDLAFIDINIGDGAIEAELGANTPSDILQRNPVDGTFGDDVLIGTDSDDALSGGSGDDILRGEGSSDLLNGNDGDDQLFGGAGSDRLHGGAGDDNDLDLLEGGAGDDILFVESHLDVALERDFGAYVDDQDLMVIQNGYANDLPNGETSSTFVFADNLGAALPSGASGYRQLVSDGIEHVRLEGTADHDIFADALDIELTGNSGDNVIHGGAGDDRVLGGAGRDNLSGGVGDDELFGGSGNDFIDGGLGEDMLYGDGGDDVFILGLHDNAIDTVFDHEGVNRLQVEGVTDETVEASLLGDDLYVIADGTPFACIGEYVGHEEAFSGIDFGEGLRSVSSLLTDHPDIESAVAEVRAEAAEAEGDDLLSAHLHLTEPTVSGNPRQDERLDGTNGDDWLSGYDGRDVLFGHEGNDILAGGDGVDDLRGGAGDDRYLFEEGERGIDKIKDTEGRNHAELKGYNRADIEGAMLGDDLAVLADGEILFTVQDFASNEASFDGVKAGNRYIQTEDLLA